MVDYSKVAVVIPTLNESASIIYVIEELIGLGITPANIIMVDGRSTDDTVAQVEKAFNGSIRIVNVQAKGKGIAMRAGYLSLLMNERKHPIDYVFCMDADFTYPAMAISKAIEGMEQKCHPKFDVAIMVRLPIQGAMPWLNMVANRVINLCANWAFPSKFKENKDGSVTMDINQKIKDVCSGLWGFRWSVFDEQIRPCLVSTGFTIEAEYFCLLKRLGIRFFQFKFVYRPRMGGVKKTKPIDVFHILRFIIGYRKRKLEYKYFRLGDPTGDASWEKI